MSAVLRNLHSVKILHSATRVNLESKFTHLTGMIKDHKGQIHGCQYIGAVRSDEIEMAVYYDIPGTNVEAFTAELEQAEKEVL